MAQLKDTTIDGILEVSKTIYIPNGYALAGYNTNGDVRTIAHINSSNNILFGHGSYNAGEGRTYIYGNDVYVASKAAGDSQFKLYYSAGDTYDVGIRTSGYCANSGKMIYFTVPLEKPVIGSPTVTATSRNGFMLLQGGKYTHGSASGTYVTPTSYSVALRNGYVIVTATMSATTNAVNLETIGILWEGTLTFS